jgi:hypothetical protein
VSFLTLQYKNRENLLLCNTQYHRKQNNWFRILPVKITKAAMVAHPDQKQAFSAVLFM